MYDWVLRRVPPSGIHLAPKEVALLMEALGAIFDSTTEGEQRRAHPTTVVRVLADAIDRAGGLRSD